MLPNTSHLAQELHTARTK